MRKRGTPARLCALTWPSFEISTLQLIVLKWLCWLSHIVSRISTHTNSCRLHRLYILSGSDRKPAPSQTQVRNQQTSSGWDYPLLGTVANVLVCQETSFTTWAGDTWRGMNASRTTLHQRCTNVSGDTVFIVGGGKAKRITFFPRPLAFKWEVWNSLDGSIFSLETEELLMCEYRHKMVVLLRDGHMVLARRN